MHEDLDHIENGGVYKYPDRDGEFAAINLDQAHVQIIHNDGEEVVSVETATERVDVLVSDEGLHIKRKGTETDAIHDIFGCDEPGC